MILGRWIGGLLGYKPFFKEYTTDWDYAVAKMRGSWFQRGLIHESYAKAKSWDEQVALDNGKLLNAEYEPWTIDLDEQASGTRANGVQTNGAHTNGVQVNGNGVVNGVNCKHLDASGLKARLAKTALLE